MPVPEYAPNDADHVDLSRLGRRAAVEAENVIAGLGDPVPSVTKARSVLWHEWQPIIGVARGIEVGIRGVVGVRGTSPFCVAKGGRGERSEAQGVPASD